MKRSDVVCLGAASIASFASLTAAASAAVSGSAAAIPLSRFAFAIGRGSGLALGVLSDSPEVVVETGDVATRIFVPRPAKEADAWVPVPAPSTAHATTVDTPPGSDVTYGRVLDRATALCGGDGGVYVAMLAFSTLPYLVFYHVARGQFWARSLPSSQAVIGLFVQPGRLYYSRAADPQLPVMHSVEVVAP